MTDATIVTIAGAISTVIASLGALVLAWRAALKAEAAAVKTEVVTEKTDALLTKTAEIHTLANDNFSKSQAALAIANEKISGLEKLITAMGQPRNEAP